ncbi:hypothetical protein FRC04_001338 [Tulasnella sp. 424]|nr:hypothetical protein FRC04_001338 [Tulasnella sp. 424]KAG8968707.1 hypothetical protein FRC05_001418 [Tulasnella sp. 425]
MDSPRQQLSNIDDKQISKALLLPTELIYIVARQIPRNKDLLSFGLAHSSFHRVVVPYYLRFREVIMRVDDFNMWNYLAGDCQRLTTVEVLRIVWEYESQRGGGPQPPLPKSAVQTMVQTEVDPLDQMQRSLEGMKRLREVSWDDSYWVPKPLKEGAPDTNQYRQRFWSVVPRLCKGVQTINLLLHPKKQNDYCWLCGPLLRELHHARNLRAFTGEFFSCNHDGSDVLTAQAQTTQNNIFSTFTGLRELSLSDTKLQVFPDLQFPALITLSLTNIEFEASNGLQRLLESSPGIISLHLDPESYLPMLRQDQNHENSASSLPIAPLLKSFSGRYEDAEFLFFNPLPDGRLRTISNLRIIEGYSAQELLPSLISAFGRAEIGVGDKLLELRIHTSFDRVEDDTDPDVYESGLLWVSWLRSIVTYCPKLRGLFIEIDEPTEPWGIDETVGWKPTLAPLKDLAVLKLPAWLWLAETYSGTEPHAIEQCLEWFPRLRLHFLTERLVLVINSEESEPETSPRDGWLIHGGQAMGRRWNLYEHFLHTDFEERIEELIA